MKIFMTPIVPIAALLCSTAMCLRSQQPPLPSAPEALPVAEPNEQALTGALAEVQRHAQLELAPKLEAAAAEAGAKVQAAQRQLQQQLATVQQAVELAQAAAPGSPPVLGDVPRAPRPALQHRLQSVVHRGHGGQEKALVIRTADADAKAQTNLEENLAVMSRIFDKTLARKLDEDRQNRYMGIDVLFGPGSTPIRSLYLDGYGALFLLNVNFPLLPPPEKPQQAKEKSESDSAWEEAERELHGQQPGGGDVFSQALRFEPAPELAQEYDEDNVNKLKDGLLDALKNATNIRDLKPDDAITVCVFGGANGGRQWGKIKGDGNVYDVKAVGWIGSDGASARGTIMTIRVKKADVDAFAKGKLNAGEFRKKASITTYAGATTGWTGGSFMSGGGFGATP